MKKPIKMKMFSLRLTKKEFTALKKKAKTKSISDYARQKLCLK